MFFCFPAQGRGEISLKGPNTGKIRFQPLCYLGHGCLTRHLKKRRAGNPEPRVLRRLRRLLSPRVVHRPLMLIAEFGPRIDHFATPLSWFVPVDFILISVLFCSVLLGLGGFGGARRLRRHIGECKKAGLVDCAGR